MVANFDADIEAETGTRRTGQGQATDPAEDAEAPWRSISVTAPPTEGDAHESMIFATYNAPVLFFH